jgi:hypothetical protein
MLNGSGLLYLLARVISAAGNFVAVAIFSRMAGPAEYGHYVLIFAWPLIVYGFGAQWMRFAYFGVYHLNRVREYVGSLARLLGGGLAIVALVLAGLGFFGLFEPRFLVAIFVLVCGMTVYEAAFEVARTLLNVRAASLSMVLRAVLAVAFGTLSLWAGGGASGLAIAIAIANVVAATPAIAAFSGVRLFAGFARRIAAHHPLRLAVAAVIRRDRGGPDHRPSAAGALSGHRGFGSLRHGRRRHATELYRTR